MIQLPRSSLSWMALRRTGVICCLCAVLTTHASFSAEEAALTTDDLGTVDVHEYTLQVSGQALPAAMEDLPTTHQRLTPESGADNQDTADQVKEVFGDVMEIVGPADTPPAERVAAKTDRDAEPAQSRPETTSNRPRSSPQATVGSTVAVPSNIAHLQSPLERCLAMHQQQILNSGEHSCWSMMHSLLGWGPTAEIRVGGPRSASRARILTWLSMNHPAAGRQLLYVSNGRIKGREGPGYQGHAAQFLAILAQTNTPPDTQLQVQGHTFTVSDLVKEEQLTCREPSELTFKLIGLSHYLDTDARWRNEQGEAWNLSRIIRAELAQPINGAACGGTHRIMGFSYATMKRKSEGKPIKGQWWRADKYAHDYREYAMSLQNPDGSFSSDWFKGRASWGDIDRKIQTTGHILEWLVYAAKEDELHDPRMARSVALLVNLLTEHRYREWEYGPKGHAIRALRLYHERVFDSPIKQQTNPLVNRPGQSKQQRTPRSALKAWISPRKFFR